MDTPLSTLYNPATLTIHGSEPNKPAIGCTAKATRDYPPLTGLSISQELEEKIDSSSA
jgi:hypothetical protein